MEVFLDAMHDVEAKTLLAEWEAEAERRAPAWERALEAQNLAPQQLLRVAAGALAGRDVLAEQLSASVDQLGAVAAFLHFRKATGQISAQDWDIFEGLLGDKTRRSLNRKASRAAHAETAQMKTEVDRWLRDQPPQSAASLAQKISKRWPIKRSTAIRWERAFRQAQAAGSP
jgi:hypothetical protein